MCSGNETSSSASPAGTPAPHPDAPPCHPSVLPCHPVSSPCHPERSEGFPHRGRKRIALLGSTGSIGCQTLDVVAQHPDKLEVVALAAGSRAAQMLQQAQQFNVSHCVIGDEEAYRRVRAEGLIPAGMQVEVGAQAVEDLVRLPEVDVVVNALVGAAGMRASYETVRAGKVLALANKESLVVAGDLICSASLTRSGRLDAASAPGGTEAPCAGHGAALTCSASLTRSGTLDAAGSPGTRPGASGSASLARSGMADAASAPGGTEAPCAGHGAAQRPLGPAAGLLNSPDRAFADFGGPGGPSGGMADVAGSIPCTHPASLIRPIDSEHGAIFQCLMGEDAREVSCLWVTASGGPFRGLSRQQLVDVTPAQALAHPTWNMGPKITIDSSTLMNKGLEVIEAHHLFAMPYDAIKVVVQPQSAIHSMVEFTDGSVKAHLGTTDMRIPIQYALSYPERWEAPVQPLDFCQLGSLEFAAPDTDTFRCLALARIAGQTGGTLPCAMNAANEVAVAAFLDERLSFLGIAETVERVMDACKVERVESIDQLAEVDAWARQQAESYI